MEESINPSIVVLKNGDQVVCDLKEVFEGEGDNKKGICLLIIHPYVLSLIAVNNQENPDQDLQVKFSKWCPYSTDYQFKISYDSVMAIGSCDPGLAVAYTSKVSQVEQLSNSRNAQLQQEEIRKIINPEVMTNE
jgi:hypothetical protein